MIGLSPLFQFLKVATSSLLAIAIATSLLLFTPSEFLESLGLIGFMQDFRKLIGALWLCSTALLVARLLEAVFKYASLKIKNYLKYRNYSRHLYELSADEKTFLRDYFLHNISTQYTTLSDGIACGLEGKAIVGRVSRLSEGPAMLFAYNMQPWAKRYINKYPHLIDWNGEMVSEDERKKRELKNLGRRDLIGY